MLDTPEVSRPDESSSDASAEELDPELAAAVDSFVDWAQHEALAASIRGLPSAAGAGFSEGTLLGDYELVRRLGVGGMGVVYEARQRRVASRRVAIKVLRTAFETRELSQRFQREVFAVASLDHPGIVPIVDAHVDEVTPYYVMKFVEGVSAARLVRELKNGPGLPRSTAGLRRFVEASAQHATGTDGPPSSTAELESSWEESAVRWIARVGLQVAEALHCAHEHGFVHRDVKPGNVMITPLGRAVLLDFGLVAPAEGEETLTRTGDFLGTLGYAAPEQARGEAMDARSDVYGLGATLYELLALRRPLEGRTRSELLQRIEHVEPPSLGQSVPRDLATIVGCALAKSPSRRYATAGLMAQDLRAFLAGQAIQARPPSGLERCVRWIRRHPRTGIALAGVLATVIGLRALSHQRARDHAHGGRLELERALGARQRLDARLADFEAARAAVPPDFLEIERLRQEIPLDRARVAEAFVAARARFEQAFEHIAGFAPARQGLARLDAKLLIGALAAYRDVLDPGEVATLEEGLRRSDDGARMARLLERRGWISLASEPAAAAVTIFAADGAEVAQDTAALYDGHAPIERLELPEGSYLARVTADGFAPARLPFLVRRAAAYDDERARPSRELRIELLPAGAIPDGFVHVPAGETLVEDDPPRWLRVESFLMGRDEVTWAALCAWSDALGAPPAELPVHADELGVWAPSAETEADHPVRGCTPMHASSWIDALDGRFPALPDDWVPSLPTAAEWIRAARGADGRPYPWGRAFDWQLCSNYVSSPTFLRDARSQPIGSFPADVSVFGVRDLAGSVAELTRDLHGPRPGEYRVYGGSFRSVAPRELAVTADGACENLRPRSDVGFRVVLRPLPEWTRAAPTTPGPFRDDFERPDAESAGHGWIELSGVPLSLRTNPNEPERCFIRAGRLVLNGGVGDFSESSGAWHGISAGAGNWTARAWIRSSCERQGDPVANERFFGVRLASGLRPRAKDTLTLALAFDGRVALRWSPTRGDSTASTTSASAGGLMVFELRKARARVEGRIWPAADPRPAAAQVSLEPFDPAFAPVFLGLEAPNRIGARLEVEQVELLTGE